MEPLQDILGHIKNKPLRDQYKLFELYKKAVNNQLVSITQDLYLKHGTLYIETIDSTWASQLHFYKNQILQAVRQGNSAIKEIKVYAGSPEAQKNPKPTKQCAQCGSKLVSDGNKLCALCQHENQEKKRLKIWTILQETPWIKYEELDMVEKKQIPYELFSQEKTFQIQRLYDTINLCNREYQRDKQPKMHQSLKEKIEGYVILKLGLKPEDLSSAIIQQHISETLFKQYQGK